MFNLFTKDSNLYALVSGKCFDITFCRDAAFSSKALGNDFMVIPNEELISSPCNGKVTITSGEKIIQFESGD